MSGTGLRRAGWAAHVTSSRYLPFAVNASVAVQGVGMEPGCKAGAGHRRAHWKLSYFAKTQPSCVSLGLISPKFNYHTSQPCLPLGRWQAGLSHSLIYTKHVSNLLVRRTVDEFRLEHSCSIVHFQTRRSSAQHTPIRRRCQLVQPAIYPATFVQPRPFCVAHQGAT